MENIDVQLEDEDDGGDAPQPAGQKYNKNQFDSGTSGENVPIPNQAIGTNPRDNATSSVGLSQDNNLNSAGQAYGGGQNFQNQQRGLDPSPSL